jgi:copper(I)-binding protein
MFLAAALGAAFVPCAWAQSAPQVSAAWARPTVAGQSAGGGFLAIQGGATADRLVGASAEVSRRVELHEMKMDGTTMRMRAIDAVDVPAGKTVKLEPGGLHLMFMELKQPLANGSSFTVKLRFEKAGEVAVPVKVQPRP